LDGTLAATSGPETPGAQQMTYLPDEVLRLWSLPDLREIQCWKLQDFGCRDISCALAFAPHGNASWWPIGGCPAPCRFAGFVSGPAAMRPVRCRAITVEKRVYAAVLIAVSRAATERWGCDEPANGAEDSTSNRLVLAATRAPRRVEWCPAGQSVPCLVSVRGLSLFVCKHVTLPRNGP
jgi:hypothetical protein